MFVHQGQTQRLDHRTTTEGTIRRDVIVHLRLDVLHLHTCTVVEFLAPPRRQGLQSIRQDLKRLVLTRRQNLRRLVHETLAMEAMRTGKQIELFAQQEIVAGFTSLVIRRQGITTVFHRFEFLYGVVDGLGQAGHVLADQLNAVGTLLQGRTNLCFEEIDFGEIGQQRQEIL